MTHSVFVAKKNFDEMSALGKQLDNAVYVDGEKTVTLKGDHIAENLKIEHKRLELADSSGSAS